MIELRLMSRYGHHNNRAAINKAFNFQPPQWEVSDGITEDSEGNAYLNGQLITEHTREVLLETIVNVFKSPEFYEDYTDNSRIGILFDDETIDENDENVILEGLLERLDALTLLQVAYLYRARSQIDALRYLGGASRIVQLIAEAEKFKQGSY